MQTETVDQTSVSLSSPPSPSSSSSPSSSTSEVPVRPPLTRGGVVPPSPPSIPCGGAVVVPEAGPALENVRALSWAEEVDEALYPQSAQDDTLSAAALEMPTDPTEIADYLVAFIERHPSVKVAVHRLVNFRTLEQAYLESGKQSEDLARALILARVPVKLPGTPPLSPYITPKEPIEFPLVHVHRPSKLKREWDLKPLEGKKAKKLARRGRRLLDKKFHGNFSETSPRMLTALEAQAAEIVKAYFRAAHPVDAPSVAAASSSSSPAAPSSSAGPSPLSASAPVEESCPTNLTPLEFTEDEVFGDLESEVEPLPIGLNLAPSPVVDEQESPSPSPPPSPRFDAWSAGAMARAMSNAEAAFPAPSPRERSVSPPKQEHSQGDGVVIEHIEDVVETAIVEDVVEPAIVEDITETSPQPPTATISTSQPEDVKPTMSLRSTAIARVITGTSARKEAKARMRRPAFIGLGIIGIGIGLATASFPSFEDLTSTFIEPSSPDLPMAATLDAIPVVMSTDIATGVGIVQTPSPSLPRNLSFSDAIPPAIDLDGVNDGQVHDPEELSIPGALAIDFDEHHSTQLGKGLSALLDFMARALVGSWFRV